VFTWLNKQGVRSAHGFEVQFTGRFDAEYREDGRLINLYVEDGLSGGLPAILIEPGSFERWKDGQPLSIDEQRRVLENFRQALEFQGLKLVVEQRESRPE
jgi:hypothetical protein